MNLNDALSSGIDKYILTKTDLGLLDFGTDPTPGTEETFATYRAAIFSQVDGRYAHERGGRLYASRRCFLHAYGSEIQGQQCG